MNLLFFKNAVFTIVFPVPAEEYHVEDVDGAAGVAITKLLLDAGFNGGPMLLYDTQGIIHYGRPELGVTKKAELARRTNNERVEGTLRDALRGADIFIGVSKGNLLSSVDVRLMGENPIIFALANPVPEISPDEAKAAGAAVVGTGRSDYANQINNSLAFPGVFRGAIDSGATRITTEMKLAAAHALAHLLENPAAEEILPFATDKRIVPAVAKAVGNAWRDRTSQ